MKTFSPNIDQISENIIYLLSLNSKISVSELSERLNLSRKVVESRVNRLYGKGFVKPLLVFNYSGLIKATVLLKLSKFDEKVIEGILQLSKLVKVKETIGQYDLSLLIISEDRKDLELALNRINKILHQRIQKMDIIIHDLEDTSGYKSFCHNPEFLSSFKILRFDPTYNLNQDERHLIDLLKHNPHQSYKELIEKTHWSFSKIKEIEQHLIDKQIIRLSIDPDYQKLGLEFHNLLVKINLAEAELFEKNIISHPRVHWIKRGVGQWDYILSICARNISEFIEITRQIRTQNKNIILDSSALISNIHMMRKI